MTTVGSGIVNTAIARSRSDVEQRGEALDCMFDGNDTQKKNTGLPINGVGRQRLHRRMVTMKPTRLLDHATTPDGTPITLHEHDGAMSIRAGSFELMSSRQHHSEERLAELACDGLRDRDHAAVLIGGLGLGFTLRETLKSVGSDATVVVAELVPAVIAWNRNPAYRLAADVIDDQRVEIVARDVADVLTESRGRFDAIMLDVDNGASGLTKAGNDALYMESGLGTARAALKPGGRLAVWSADNDPRFAARMEEAGFSVESVKARTYPTGGSWNWIFVGKR